VNYLLNTAQSLNNSPLFWWSVLPASRSQRPKSAILSRYSRPTPGCSFGFHRSFAVSSPGGLKAVVWARLEPFQSLQLKRETTTLEHS
jgi:hypothetical protein